MQNRFFNFPFLLAITFLLATGSPMQLQAKPENTEDELEVGGLATENSVQLPAESPPIPPVPPKGEPPPPPAPPRDAANSSPHRQGPRHEHRQIHRGDEMEVLDRLLSMPPEKLARIRHALEKIESMTPEERERFRLRLRDIREISPERRREMREEWRKLSPEERREHIREMRERPWKKVLEDEEAEEREAVDSENPSAIK